jgi:hypothetical protein
MPGGSGWKDIVDVIFGTLARGWGCRVRQLKDILRQLLTVGKRQRREQIAPPRPGLQACLNRESCQVRDPQGGHRGRKEEG